MIGGLLPYVAVRMFFVPNTEANGIPYAIYPAAVILLVAVSEKQSSEPVAEKSVSIHFAQRPTAATSYPRTTHSIIQTIAEHMRSSRLGSDEGSGTSSVEEKRRSVEHDREEGSSGKASTAATVVYQ